MTFDRHSFAPRLPGSSVSVDADGRAGCPLGVADSELHPVAIPKIELGKVAVQVLLAAVLIDSLHAALEDGEVALGGLRVDDAAHGLAFAVERDQWPAAGLLDTVLS